MRNYNKLLDKSNDSVKKCIERAANGGKSVVCYQDVYLDGYADGHNDGVDTVKSILKDEIINFIREDIENGKNIEGVKNIEKLENDITNVIDSVVI